MNNNLPRILFIPIHYILDAENSGSEISWAYSLYKYLSVSKSISPVFVTGGTRGIKDNNVYNVNIFSAEKLNLSLFKMLEIPIMTGLSRKSSIYKTLNVPVEDSLNGTTILHILALQNGADILRVHDVKEAKEAVALFVAYGKA